MPAPPSSADGVTAAAPRWALWVPVLFAVGIAVYFALPVEPSPAVAGLLALALAGAVAAARLWPRGDVMFLALAVLFAGILAGLAATWRVAAPVHAKNRWHDVDGRVVNISRMGAGAHAIWLSDGEIIVGNVAAGRGRRPWSVRRDNRCPPPANPFMQDSGERKERAS